MEFFLNIIETIRNQGFSAEMNFWTDVSEIIRNIGLIFAAGLAFWVAYKRNKIADKQAKTAQDQFKIAENNHLAETFTKAIEQIGKKEKAIQLGGLYALEKIARSNQLYHKQIMEVLCAFVRLHAPILSPEEATDDGPAIIVQTALTIIGRRNIDFDKNTEQQNELAIDLSATNLYLINLEGANLEGANLAEANLVMANLKRAKLRAANLVIASLNGAHLEGADLEGVDLRHADLQRTFFSGASLEGAKLEYANFSGANLQKADLTGAQLQHANFSGANLEGASLREADLREANLQGHTFFEGKKLEEVSEKDRAAAKLHGAKDYEGANLTGSTVTIEQIKSATIDDTTVLPDHIERNLLES